MVRNQLTIILIGVAIALLPPLLAAQDAAIAVRRLATTSRLAADEYRLGVASGKVILPAEVDEAKLFLSEAKKTSAALPPGVADTVGNDLDRLVAMVGRAAPPESIAVGVERMVDYLGGRLAVSLEEVPSVAPSLARGAEVYRERCQSCHGETGGGDGPAGKGLTPPPAKLDDRAR